MGEIEKRPGKASTGGENRELTLTEHLYDNRHAKDFKHNLDGNSWMERIIDFSILQMRRPKLSKVK